MRTVVTGGTGLVGSAINADMKLSTEDVDLRDWVHVQDHCEAIDLVLHKGRDGEVYNIGGEDEKRNIDIVFTILDGLGKTQKSSDGYASSTDLIEYVEDRKGHDWRYAMNISKIINELWWSPRINFKEGMGELLK